MYFYKNYFPHTGLKLRCGLADFGRLDITDQPYMSHFGIWIEGAS